MILSILKLILGIDRWTNQAWKSLSKNILISKNVKVEDIFVQKEHK